MASVLHGKADGVVPPWGVEFLDAVDGVRLSTDEGVVDVLLGPDQVEIAGGSFETDAACIVAADSK